MRSLRWFVLLVACVFAGVACGSSDDDSGTAQSPSTEPGGDGDEGESEFDESAALRYGSPYQILYMDPHKSVGDGNNREIFTVYDRLVGLSPEGELVPQLAAEWGFAEDGKVLEMTLREGVVFQDGEVMDGDAVKASIERGQTLPDSKVAADLAVIEEVEVVSDLEIRLILAQVDATVPHLLAGRPGAVVSPKENANADLPPAGAGMFRLASFVPNVSADMERWEGYWDPESVNVAELRFITIVDPLARLNALKTGEIDATLLDATVVEAAEAAGIAVTSAKTNRFWHMQFNRTHAPLDDVLVRQAVNHAIDREALVEGLLFGRGEPGIEPFPEGFAAHSGMDDAYPYDPEKARELLAEAGHPDGFDLGMVAINVPQFAQVAEAVQGQLAEVGIRAEITQTLNVSEMFYVNGEGDAAVFWVEPKPAPIVVKQLYSAEGFSNPGGHTTPEIDALYDELLTTFDQDAQFDILEQISANVTENALDVVLYYIYDNMAQDEKVVGYQPYLIFPEFRGIGISA